MKHLDVGARRTAVGHGSLGMFALRLRTQQAPANLSFPTIRVHPRWLLVDVVVTDQRGQAITGPGGLGP
jgi:hypothetical protein